MRVITKSDDRAAGVRFFNHENDYRPNWTTRSLITKMDVELKISDKKISEYLCDIKQDRKHLSLE